MITQKEYGILIGNLKRCCITCSIPFVWDSENSKLRPAKSRLNQLVSISTSLMYLIGVPNSFLGILKMYRDSKESGVLSGEFFIGIVYFVGFTILGSFHVNFVKNKESIADSFNGLMHYNLYYKADGKKFNFFSNHVILYSLLIMILQMGILGRLHFSKNQKRPSKN